MGRENSKRLSLTVNISSKNVSKDGKAAIVDLSKREAQPAPFFGYVDHSLDEDPDPLSPLSPPLRTPSFPAKMHAILFRKDLAHMIEWMPHGRSWRITDPAEFEEKVIPLYFEHHTIASFHRQANGWGFCRMNKDQDRGSYYHECFLRGMPFLCKQMKRLGTAKKLLTGNKEPILSEISAVRPVPDDVPSDSLAAIMLTAINKCIMEGGPKAKMPVVHEAMKDYSLFTSHLPMQKLGNGKAGATDAARLDNESDENQKMPPKRKQSNCMVNAGILDSRYALPQASAPQDSAPAAMLPPVTVQENGVVASNVATLPSTRASVIANIGSWGSRQHQHQHPQVEKQVAQNENANNISNALLVGLAGSQFPFQLLQSLSGFNTNLIGQGAPPNTTPQAFGCAHRGGISSSNASSGLLSSLSLAQPLVPQQKQQQPHLPAPTAPPKHQQTEPQTQASDPYQSPTLNALVSQILKNYGCGHQNQTSPSVTSLPNATPNQAPAPHSIVTNQIGNLTLHQLAQLLSQGSSNSSSVALPAASESFPSFNTQFLQASSTQQQQPAPVPSLFQQQHNASMQSSFQQQKAQHNVPVPQPIQQQPQQQQPLPALSSSQHFQNESIPTPPTYQHNQDILNSILRLAGSNAHRSTQLSSSTQTTAPAPQAQCISNHPLSLLQFINSSNQGAFTSNQVTNPNPLAQLGNLSDPNVKALIIKAFAAGAKIGVDKLSHSNEPAKQW